VSGIVYTSSLELLLASVYLFLALQLDFLEQRLVLGCCDMEVV
jgi:hypothetical protein